MDSEPRTRVRGISAKTLSSCGYAVCFFPEQPQQQTIVEQDRATEEIAERKAILKVEAVAKPISKTGIIRLYWRNRLVYLIAFISYSLSLNNIYHFPVNMYRYGYQFLFPYTIATLVIGYPLHVLQTSLGQYSQRGPLWMWECAPLFCGVGFAMIISCIFISMYHNIFAAYSLVYFARCFSTIFPWIFCDHNSCDEENICTPSSWYVSENTSGSSKDYFYNIVVNSAYRYPSEVWDLGSFKWWLFLSLIFSWFVIYIATLRSARSIGKIAIVIVIFSYFAIVSLLIAFFRRSDENQERKTETKSMFNVHMWYTAIVQVLLELGLCFGVPVTYGSYCRFRNLVYIDSIILCVINYFNSIVFCLLFFDVFRRSICIDSGIRWLLPDDTMAVIYIVYSEALALIPGKHYWCILFFFMLFCVLIGTQIALTETVMTIIYDNFHDLSNQRWLYNLLFCSFFLIIGMLFCFSNGFNGAVMLYYIPTFVTAVIITLFFVIGIVLIYGLNKYFDDMQLMLNKNLNFIVKLFFYLLVILLIVAFVILVFSLGSMSLITGIFYYSSHAFVAWVICLFIIFPLIICAILWIIYCRMESVKVCRSSNSWLRSQEDRKQGAEQYTTEYDSSFTWKWNSYAENENNIEELKTKK